MSMDEVDRELALVTRAAQGDAVAITLLLKDSRRWMCSVIGQRVPGDLRGLIDADDVVQETHVEVFRHATSFEPHGVASFHRWALKIAMRKLKDMVRAQRALRR